MRKNRLSEKFLERRNHASPEGDHNSNWAISYGDMITLLLAFFVMFFSVDKSSEKAEIKLLAQLIQKEFKEQREPAAERTWGMPTENEAGNYVGMGEIIKEKLNVSTAVKGNRLIIEFPDTSFFNTADYKLTQSGVAALERFAKVFTKFSGQLRLVVRGYTDNRPVRAGARSAYSDNLELSSLRAISALRVMEANGVPFSLMRIGGYGETDKSKAELDAKQLALDRKIVLVIEPLDKTERNAAVKDWSRGLSSDSAKGVSQ
ncbi:MAG TPA: hypothetical protein DCL41_05645 [Bdellovibrionales bacterium]|nr:hypothetical protein [Pseudobdellovibrionaceae bacterium]HAG91332.1 hypothetical protein [Bdellovibrionales bacterium]